MCVCVWMLVFVSLDKFCIYVSEGGKTKHHHGNFVNPCAEIHRCHRRISTGVWERETDIRVYLYPDRLYFNHLLIFRLVCVPRRCLLCIFMRHAPKKKNKFARTFLISAWGFIYRLHFVSRFCISFPMQSPIIIYTIYLCMYVYRQGVQRGAGKGDRDCDRLATNFVSAFNQFTYKQVWYYMFEYVDIYIERYLFILSYASSRVVNTFTVYCTLHSQICIYLWEFYF